MSFKSKNMGGSDPDARRKKQRKREEGEMQEGMMVLSYM